MLFGAFSLAGKNPAGFSFSVQGETGRNYRIEASTNLVNWTIVGQVTVTNSPVQFVYPGANQFNARFYRIVGP